MTKFHIEKGDLSDGYHTFTELYAHRIILWINLCLATAGNRNSSYFVQEHFEGWDLLVMYNSNGDQMSYHVPMSNRYLYDKRIKKMNSDQHEFDGHTSSDVIKRLTDIVENDNKKP